mgnify:CR=1 FL=1
MTQEQVEQRAWRRLEHGLVADGVETARGTGVSNNDDGPDFIVLNEGSINYTMQEDQQPYLVFTPSGSVTTAADVLYHAVVNIDRPV